VGHGRLFRKLRRNMQTGIQDWVSRLGERKDLGRIYREHSKIFPGTWGGYFHLNLKIGYGVKVCRF